MPRLGDRRPNFAGRTLKQAFRELPSFILMPRLNICCRSGCHCNRLLAKGLRCANDAAADPNFVPIGNPDLINRRAHRRVPIAPGGTLADYVPFYFTPKSPMLLNIKTGYNGIARRPNEVIAILVSSCQVMTNTSVLLLFTDGHAMAAAVASWPGPRVRQSEGPEFSHGIAWQSRLNICGPFSPPSDLAVRPSVPVAPSAVMNPEIATACLEFERALIAARNTACYRVEAAIAYAKSKVIPPAGEGLF